MVPGMQVLVRAALKVVPMVSKAHLLADIIWSMGQLRLTDPALLAQVEPCLVQVASACT